MGGVAKGEAIKRLKQVNFSFKWVYLILRLHKFTLKVKRANLRFKGQKMGLNWTKFRLMRLKWVILRVILNNLMLIWAKLKVKQANLMAIWANSRDCGNLRLT